MSTTLIPQQGQSASGRLRKIRSHWSPAERRQRARVARHRQRELLSLIVSASDDVWATGALMPADVERLGR